MVSEALEYLDPKPGYTMLDCTVGAGGHSEKILEKIGPAGRLIGIDSDEEILEIARNRLKGFKGNFILSQANFRGLDVVLADAAIDRVDGVLFDLGVSGYQLESAERGFSFNLDGPLDMRMDRVSAKETARDLVNSLNKEEIADILFKFGQERYSKRIAEAIVRQRRAKPIETTARLKDIILKAVPRSKKWQRIHPATRTFLGLRIAVNDELNALEEGLNKAIRVLKSGGRICVISFHSLEDRIVKNIFKEFDKKGVLKILTKKPIGPSQVEVGRNPRARSAKLRAARKVA